MATRCRRAVDDLAGGPFARGGSSVQFGIWSAGERLGHHAISILVGIEQRLAGFFVHVVSSGSIPCADDYPRVFAMPGDDGYTLIRKIRTRTTEQGGRMLAVALTAYGRNEDRMEALLAGFQVHVGKPVEPNQLVSVVARVTGYASPAQH